MSFFGCQNEEESIKAVTTIDKIYSPLSDEFKNAPSPDFSFCDEVVLSENNESQNKIQAILTNTKLYRRSYNPTSYRASMWLPAIKQIVRSYDLPEDLAYIPVVESKLKNLSSNKGAAGFWQMIPSTARENGLIVNDSIDDRLDQIKSTHAACRYLKKLRRQLPNWSLVIAAYNSGLGNVNRTRKSHPEFHDSFFSHKWNKETTNYIHRLYATKEILEHKDHYNIKSYDQLTSMVSYN